MGDSYILQYLEKRVHRSECATQTFEDKVVGGAPLLDRDVEVDCEGGILDYC